MRLFIKQQEKSKTAPLKKWQKNRHEDIFLLYSTEYRKGTESQHVLCNSSDSTPG